MPSARPRSGGGGPPHPRAGPPGTRGRPAGGLTMAAMQQIWANSCAAASLLCAAHELGVREFPAVRKYSLWAAAAPLRLDSESQRRIYQWTSRNPAMTTMPYDWGYSWPVDIATCAEALGLSARILIYSTWTAWALKNLKAYRDQWRRIQKYGNYEEVGVDRSTHRLKHDQRELKVIAEWQDLIGPVKKLGSLHTVLVRPNGQVMEPGEGRDMTLVEAKHACRMHGTGLSILIWPPRTLKDLMDRGQLRTSPSTGRLEW